MAGSFRFIMQKENAFQLHLLQLAHNQSSSEHRSLPPVPPSESQALPQSVPHIIDTNSESVFRALQIPVTISEQRVNFTTNVVNSDTKSPCDQQSPRPLNLVTNNIERENDIPNSQPLSPSLLSPAVPPGNNLREKEKQFPEAPKPPSLATQMWSGGCVASGVHIFQDIANVWS